MQMEVNESSLQRLVMVAEQETVINAFCDFALALFPLTFVKDLQLQLRKKVVLGSLMSCGIM